MEERGKMEEGGGGGFPMLFMLAYALGLICVMLALQLATWAPQRRTGGVGLHGRGV